MHSSFTIKKEAIQLKNSVFWKLEVLEELISRHIFQFSIFALKESSKLCLVFPTFLWIFSYIFVVFMSSQELPLNQILKEFLIPEDLQIIRKRVDTVLISVKLYRWYSNTVMHLGLGVHQVQHTVAIWIKKAAISQA